MKLGIVAFSNNSGLGNQTRRLVDMLKPYKLLIVDSTAFSKNGQKNLEWYRGYKSIVTNKYLNKGFPTNLQIKLFLSELTHVLCCENPLNFYLFSGAEKRGIKTYVQSNYEFCDNLRLGSLPMPTKFLMPSHWKVEEMQERFGKDKVSYLPPPINPEEFKVAREDNILRSGKVNFLHIVGTLAAHDRNGTLDLLGALKLTKSDFNLTIKSQHKLPAEYIVSDSRVTYKIGDEPDVVNLYKGFDVLVLPRRYGGLCLSMNEALMSAMPVIMPKISPNDKALPASWLVNAHKTGEFMARVPIDIYTSNPQHLADRIDYFATEMNIGIKNEALYIAMKHYSDTALKFRYEALWI